MSCYFSELSRSIRFLRVFYMYSHVICKIFYFTVDFYALIFTPLLDWLLNMIQSTGSKPSDALGNSLKCRFLGFLTEMAVYLMGGPHWNNSPSQVTLMEVFGNSIFRDSNQLNHPHFFLIGHWSDTQISLSSLPPPSTLSFLWGPVELFLA
jgi:hypothetical protein